MGDDSTSPRAERRVASPPGDRASDGLLYDALFEAMNEGFALCETLDRAPLAARDPPMADYRIVEINPSLQAMLGVGREVRGRRLSDGGAPDQRWLAVCDRVLRTGEPASFEFHNGATGRWHDIRINRVGPGRMAQFFFDVTDRKAAEARLATMFEELNHRVKNNLAAVAALLTLQGQAASRPVKAELAKAAARIQAIAAAHEALREDPASGEIDFAAYLENLCRHLRASLFDRDRLRLELEVEPVRIAPDKAAPLGIIVNELVTNAVKHAYPPPARGAVRVRLTRTDAGGALSVEDDGPGLPAGQEPSAGLGLRILEPMVRQLGGALAIRRDGGAAFEIRFA